MRFCILSLMLSVGCSTPPKGTGDTAKPVRPMDDADADDADADGVDADDAAGDDGGPDTADAPEEPPAPYALEVTPGQVNFGPVSVGDSQSQLVDVKNVGTEAVHINGVAVSDRTAFDILPDFMVPITFTPGMERSIRVSFNPSDSTTYSEEVTFLTEELLDESADIPLQGRGEAADCDICSPIIEVSPRELTIDALLTCSATESVTVRNEGDRPLRVTSVDIINDSIFMCGTFRKTGGGAMTLAPYSEGEINVTYTATSECADLFTLGSEENTLRITSNDPVDPVYSVGLTGYATCLIAF